MSLARCYLRAIGRQDDVTSDLQPSLEVALCSLLATGQKCWPQLRVDDEAFIRFLAQQLPAETTPPVLQTLRAGDLYLVAAFALHDRAAQVILEQDYVPQVRQALRQVGAPDTLTADILQDVCGRLIERQRQVVRRRSYEGSGELTAWLIRAAVREAIRRQKRERRATSLAEIPETRLASPTRSPEQQLQDARLKEDFQLSFREAVRSLTARDRNLLRYHFIHRKSIDQIGVIYRVHRATAARWIVQAQESLMIATRERFVARTNVSHDSIPNLIAELHSQLSLRLESVLGAEPC